MAYRQNTRYRWLGIVASLCLLIAAGCADNGGQTAERQVRDTADIGAEAPSDSLSTSGEEQEQHPAVHYRRVPVPGRKGLDSLKQLVGEEHLATVLKLNRKDARNIARNDTLIVPDTLGDFMLYTPFPRRVPAVDSIRKLILVDQRIQAVAAYEYGRLVRWTPTSTGKKSTPTDTGLFHTNWRSRKRSSTIDSDWIMEWYWNLANFSGVSMHQYELPGYPASHACVRLPEDDARWFYDWAEAWRLDSGQVAANGTPVVIYNTYHFGEPAPWKLLPEAPDTTRIAVDELTDALAHHVPTMLREQQVRDSVLAAPPVTRPRTAPQPTTDTTRHPLP